MSEAIELNAILENQFPLAMRLLSERGKRLFFPSKGILKQSADANRTDINATIGIAMNDDGTPMSTSALLESVGRNPGLLKYSPSFGVPLLREKWQQEIRKKNPSLGNALISMPIVTGGLTHGLSTLASMFINPGEEIILPDKFWGNYRLIFEIMNDAKLKTFELFKNDKFNVDGLKEKLKEKGNKKVVILNFPNNPTGYTPTKIEMRNIIEALVQSADDGKDILVICDDAYFGLVFEDGIELESPFAYLANAHQNIMVAKVDGATKEEFSWGLRVGFVTMGGKNMSQEAAKALEQKIAGSIRGNCSSCCTVSQHAVWQALESPTHVKEKLRNFEILKSRFDKAKEILCADKDRFAKHFRLVPSNSGYFFCLEINEKINTQELRKLLIEKSSVGTIAIGQLLRIAFSATNEKNLPSLIESIFTCCEELSNL